MGWGLGGLGKIGGAILGGSGLGGIVGSTVGALGGIGLEGYLNMEAQRDARIASEDMYRQRYRIMVNDLMAAGLNPMLAYMKDAGTPPAVGGGAVVHGVGQTVNSAIQNSAQRSLMSEQEEAVKAQARASDAAAARDNAQAAKTMAETPEIAKVMQSQAYRDTAAGQLSDTQAAQTTAMLPSVLLKARSEAEAAELMLPKLRNMADAEYSDWKRKVSPYLDDILTMSQSANQLSSALSITKIFDLLDKMRISERRFPRRYGPSGEQR